MTVLPRVASIPSVRPIVLLLILCAQTWTPLSIAQPDPVPLEDPYLELDLEENSGWIRVELAVLVDDRAEVLNSEFWPPFPSARYPGTYRWLFDDKRLTNVANTYPMAEVSLGELGRITAAVPDPEIVIANAIAEAEAALAEPETEDLPIEDEPEVPAPIPLELIDVEPTPTRASVEWLDEFAEDTQEDTADGAYSDTEGGADPEMAAATDDGQALATGDLAEFTDTPPEPRFYPIPFKRRSVQMLDEGLSTLLRQTPNRLEMRTAWLQPPDARNLPIILDYSGDSELWPRLQGFIEIRRGSDVKLGVNVWWNTQAEYYPDTFGMSPPPRGPAQITLIDPTDGYPLTQLEAIRRQEELIRIKEMQHRGETLVSYVDPETGFYRQETPAEPLVGGAPDDAFAWPWRHFLHVADTRSLPEGSVRYFDHPVLKIVATYRELTWEEVLATGQEDQKSLEFERAIEAAKAEQNEGKQPSGAVPPDSQPVE